MSTTKQKRDKDDPRLDWRVPPNARGDYEAEFFGGTLNIALVGRRWNARVYGGFDNDIMEELGNSERGIGAYTAMRWAENEGLAWVQSELARLLPARLRWRVREWGSP